MKLKNVHPTSHRFGVGVRCCVSVMYSTARVDQLAKVSRDRASPANVPAPTPIGSADTFRYRVPACSTTWTVWLPDGVWYHCPWMTLSAHTGPVLMPAKSSS